MKSRQGVSSEYNCEKEPFKWGMDHAGARQSGVQVVLVGWVAKPLVNRRAVHPEPSTAINFICAVFGPPHERAAPQGFH